MTNDNYFSPSRCLTGECYRPVLGRISKNLSVEDESLVQRQLGFRPETERFAAASDAVSAR